MSGVWLCSGRLSSGSLRLLASVSGVVVWPKHKRAAERRTRREIGGRL